MILSTISSLEGVNHFLYIEIKYIFLAASLHIEILKVKIFDNTNIFRKRRSMPAVSLLVFPSVCLLPDEAISINKKILLS